MRRLTVAFYRRRWVRDDWSYPIDDERLVAFLRDLNEELQRYDLEVEMTRDDSVAMDIRGYGDLLNSVRLRFPAAGFGNLCLGHVIGASKQRDLCEDIRRGVNRLAFAPETIEPEGSDKIVCHNCGCGC